MEKLSILSLYLFQMTPLTLIDEILWYPLDLTPLPPTDPWPHNPTYPNHSKTFFITKTTLKLMFEKIEK